ncbi:MAG: TIGR03936 family radical SAM-associated protein, partial [Acidimicrobiia bacterium]
MHARLKYSKQGRVRFIGHRDLARALERALRVAQVPLAFTEGFSPHPKISFGHALTVGAESVAEYLDITTRE